MQENTNSLNGKAIGGNQEEVNKGRSDVTNRVGQENNDPKDSLIDDQTDDGSTFADSEVEINDQVDDTPDTDSIETTLTDTGSDSGGGGRLMIPELKLRCTRFPRWSASQVRRCMAMATAATAERARIWSG